MHPRFPARGDSSTTGRAVVIAATTLVVGLTALVGLRVAVDALVDRRRRQARRYRSPIIKEPKP